MNSSLPNKRRGVTWWELLFVLALLAVVAVILFPVFARSHGRHHGSCAGNLKQIGLALIQYADDNDGNPPPGTQPTPGLGWAGQIYPYMKSVPVFHCPDDAPSEGSQSTSVMSYAYNSNVPLWSRLPSHTLVTLPVPARVVLGFEIAGDRVKTIPSSYMVPGIGVFRCDALPPDEGAAQGARTFSPAGDGTANGLHSTLTGPDRIHYATGDLGGRPHAAPSQFEAARHEGGSDFLLADAHVKWLKPERVSTGTDAPTPSAAQTGGVTGTAAGTDNRAYAVTFSVK